MESEALSQEVRNSEWFKLEAVEQENPKTPGWFGEAALLGKYWHESGLLNELIDSVFVTRGRMGRYEVCDARFIIECIRSKRTQKSERLFPRIESIQRYIDVDLGKRKMPSSIKLE